MSQRPDVREKALCRPGEKIRGSRKGNASDRRRHCRGTQGLGDSDLDRSQDMSKVTGTSGGKLMQRHMHYQSERAATVAAASTYSLG